MRFLRRAGRPIPTPMGTDRHRPRGFGRTGADGFRPPVRAREALAESLARPDALRRHAAGAVWGVRSPVGARGRAGVGQRRCGAATRYAPCA
ncbi:hypothetical protein SHO565_01790 [Streptomyces sp. HO565]